MMNEREAYIRKIDSLAKHVARYRSLPTRDEDSKYHREADRSPSGGAMRKPC